MSPHEWSEGTKRLIDLVAFICAGVAGISLAQAAVFMSFAAATVSVFLGGIRVYDRFKYGPAKRGE